MNARVGITLFLGLALCGWAKADVVGMIAATQEVDRFGAFNYRLSLSMPPGVAGFIPDIALLYNSQSGNGLLGRGWQIEGLSSVHRCLTTHALHNQRRPLTFSDADTLCLDGHYLEAVAEHEYRTRVESFTKIVRHRSGKHDTFSARTRDGKIIRYGERKAWSGRSGQDSKVLSWLMSSFSDQNGNQIQFYYFGGTKQKHLRRIVYGSNVITFRYERRDEPMYSYVEGIHLPLTRRIKRIEVHTDNVLIREYSFAYHEAAMLVPERLSEVTECDGDGACLRPTRFIWQRTGEFAAVPVAVLAQTAGNDSRRYHVADFNGDGVADVYVFGAFKTNEDLVYLGRADGHFEEAPGAGISLDKEDDLSNLVIADFNGDGLSDIYHFRYRDYSDLIYLATMRGGYLDFEIVTGIDSGIATKPSIGSQCIHVACLKLGDFNGDGRTDIYHVRHDAGNAMADDVYLSNGDGSYERIDGVQTYQDLQGKKLSEKQLARLRVADFNGDMLADIYQIRHVPNESDEIFLSDGNGGYQKVSGIPSGIQANQNISDESQRLKFGDFNGDGLTDVYHVTPAVKYLVRGVGPSCSQSSEPGSYPEHPAFIVTTKTCYRDVADKVYISKGNGHYVVRAGLQSPESRSYLRADLDRIKPVDFNADGLTDIYYAGHNAQSDAVWLATHAGIFHQKTGVADNRSRQRTANDLARTGFGDFNGDGNVDVYQLSQNAKDGIQIFLNQLSPPLIVSTINGLGLQTSVTYTHLPAVADQSGGEYAYPISSAAAPIWLVTELAVNGVVAERFRYADARTDFSGLGSMGFTLVEQSDLTHGVVEQTTYALEFPYLGKPREYAKGLDEDGSLGEVFLHREMTYQTLDMSGGITQLPHLESTIETRFELDGTRISETTTEYDVPDEYGNVGLIRVATTDDKNTFIQETHNVFDPDEEQWLPGRLVRQTVTYENDYGEPITHTTEYEYASVGLNILREVVEPGHTLSYLREYEYDTFGNRLAEIIRPANGQTEQRARRYEYDEQGLFAIAVTNAQGYRETRAYDLRHGKPTVLTDANRLSVKRHYDAWGRLTREILPDGSSVTTSYSYDLTASAPADSVYQVKISASGYPKRVVYYDRLQRPIREVNVGFNGHQTFQDSVYDGLSDNLLAVSVPYYEGEDVAKIVWTKRTYDSLGRVVNETTPLPGREVSFAVHYEGDYEARTNTYGQQQSLIRDALGRVVEINDPMGARMAFEYDPLGRLTRIIDGNGAETVMSYDLFGNRTAIHDMNRGTQAFAYDAFGQMIWSLDARGHNREFYYDRLGRMVKREDYDGVFEWRYDTSPYGIGKLAEEIAPTHTRKFQYDEYGRLAQIDDQRGYVVGQRYNRHGRLARIDYPRGFSLQRLYSRYGHLSGLRGLVRESEMPVATVSAKVDYAGKADEFIMRADFYKKLATQQTPDFADYLTDAAVQLEDGAYTLRQKSALESDDEYVLWQDCEYMSETKISRAERMIDESETAYPAYRRSHYKLARQLLEEADFYLNCYEAADRGVTAEVKASLKQVDFWQVTERDAVGSVIEEIRGNDWTTHTEYDSAHHPVRLATRAQNGEQQRNLTYFYDELGNIVDRHDYVRDVDEYFTYDELNRLVSAVPIGLNGDNDTRSYDYDVNGNLIFKSDLGAYQYADSGLAYTAVQAGNKTYSYDAAGYLREGPDYKVDWNVAGKPLKIQAEDGSVEYSYDANDARVAKRLSDGGVVHYVGDLFEEKIDGNRREFCNKIYAERRLVAVYCESDDIGQTHYLYYDVLGSVDTIADSAGKVTARFDYFPFGERRHQQGQAVLQRGFTGHEHIEFAALIHMNGRIYDPRMGRFLSPDPHVPAPLASQSYNTYAYVMNNPLRYNDPSGFFFKKVLKKIGRLFKKAVNYVKSHARTIAAAFAGHYIGNWIAANLIKAASSQLIWSPAAMANGSYMGAYNQIVATAGLTGGAVAGGTAALLSGGNLQEVAANALGGGISAAVSSHYKNVWSPQRVATNAAVSGATSALAGGSFKNAALAGLKGGGLRYAAIMMRKMMIAQSMGNPDNAGGMSVGFMGDRFKLGGARDDMHGARSGIFGGSQGGQGKFLGTTYAPGSWQDYLVEAFAGPHDFLNSWYWYDRSGNSKTGFSPLRRWVGEGLNGANVILAAPFVAASVAPDYFYSLPH